MLQSLHLLSLPILELEMHMKHELITNPMLEMQEEDESHETEAEKKENAESKESDQDFEPDTDIESVTESNTEDLKETIDEAKELSEILDTWNDYHTDERMSFRDGPEEVDHENTLRIQEDKKQDYLDQLDNFELTEDEHDYATDLIDTANAHGYLAEDFNIYSLASEYGIEPDRADEIHEIVLHLDPAGITARNIPECLMAQLTPDQLENPILSGIIQEDFCDLIHRRYQNIASKYRITVDAVLEIKEEISVLDPKPGLRLVTSETNYMVPDVIIKKIDNEYELIINDAFMPNIIISRRYRDIIKNMGKDRDALNYVRSKINSAKFLIKSMYMRNRTLERVMRSIIQHQRQFFYNETGILEPLTYSTIAAELQVNESTISRVVRSKYADTPFGVMCLKDFFTSTAGKDKNYDAVSRQLVERNIREMIENEDKRKPISDQDIANILKERGISVSRRVIAKYREGLGILNSRLRRKE